MVNMTSEITEKPRTTSDTSDEALLNEQPCARDRLLFAYLQLLQDVVTVREDMQRTFDEGFIQLAKSKTLMGFATLEFDQMRSESCESAVTFDIDTQKDDDDNEAENSDSVIIQPAVNPNLLRSGLARACVLAPSSLRKTQNCFRRLAELSADLHNVYSRLACVSRAFHGQPCNCDHEFCHKLKSEG